MAGFNHLRSRSSAHRQIKRWGGTGYLVRSGVKRPATMAILEFSPRDRGLIEEGVERIRMSSVGVTVPADKELDTVEFKGRRYNIQEPVEGPRPNGIVIFYDLHVIFTGNV
jgi:hypothetical protein